MKITVHGVDETIRRLERYTEDFAKDIIIELTEDVYQNAKHNIKPHTKPGGGTLENNLTQRYKKRTNTGQVFIDDSGMMVQWRGKPINYALFVHMGTKPHTIEPKKKKALRWSGPSGFEYVFKKVKHPGYKGDPFMTDAARKTMRNIDNLVKGIL